MSTNDLADQTLNPPLTESNGVVPDGTPDVSAEGAADQSADTPEQQPVGPVRKSGCIWPTHVALAQPFIEAVDELEQALGMPVWLLIQSSHEGPYIHFDEAVRKAFFTHRDGLLVKGQKVAVVIDSPGGQADAAYQLATMLRRFCGGFAAIVPRYAKSAATLFALGAEDIYMGMEAQLGPLDAQLWEDDREDWTSALDEVQALERLNVAALEQMDQAMIMLAGRTGKKIETLLPHALRYTADMMRPLLERIDTVHYTQQSRVLKVAEDYAERLLKPYYAPASARNIAFHLVNNYPAHGFVIDREEASTFLNLAEPTDEQESAINKLEMLLTTKRITALGRLTKMEGSEQV